MPLARTANVYALVDSFADLTPSLGQQLLTLTGTVANINATRIKSFKLQAAQTGTAGTVAVTCPTPVAGTTYYHSISWLYPGSAVQTETFSVYADATITTASLLATAFETKIDAAYAAGRVPFNASTSTATLTSTAQVATGYVVGELKFSDCVFGYGSSTATVTVTNGTIPYGQYTQVARDVSGATSGKTYTTVTIVTLADRDAPATVAVQQASKLLTYTIYIQDDMTSYAFAASIINQYIAVLGFSAGGPVALVPTATAPGDGAIMPIGAKAASVTSANSAHLVGLIAGQPVGTEYFLTGNATAYTIKMPTGEKLNSGVAAGTAAVTAARQLWLRKTATDNWIGQVFTTDGTDAVLTQVASS